MRLIPHTLFLRPNLTPVAFYWIRYRFYPLNTANAKFRLFLAVLRLVVLALSAHPCNNRANIRRCSLVLQSLSVTDFENLAHIHNSLLHIRRYVIPNTKRQVGAFTMLRYIVEFSPLAALTRIKLFFVIFHRCYFVSVDTYDICRIGRLIRDSLLWRTGSQFRRYSCGQSDKLNTTIQFYSLSFGLQWYGSTLIGSNFNISASWANGG